jgi:predicted metal-dependent phosphotriesterase family hydrolase
LNHKITAAGSLVSIDGIGRKPEKEHVAIIMPLIEKSPDRLLLSMDSGWYHVGEPNGGKIDGFTALSVRFLPSLREAGISAALIRRITVENPATIFTSSVL